MLLFNIVPLQEKLHVRPSRNPPGLQTFLSSFSALSHNPSFSGHNLSPRQCTCIGLQNTKYLRRSLTGTSCWLPTVCFIPIHTIHPLFQWCRYRAPNQMAKRKEKIESGERYIFWIEHLFAFIRGHPRKILLRAIDICCVSWTTAQDTLIGEHTTEPELAWLCV